MNRGPAEGAGRNAAMAIDHAAKAAAAWPAPLPDWVDELARIADARGLKGAAKAIGYSPSVVSQVIGGIYRGDFGRVEEKVRGALMGVEVMCPVLGEIGRHDCLDHQKKKFAATNAIRTRLYHACRGGCPNSRLSSVPGRPSGPPRLLLKE